MPLRRYVAACLAILALYVQLAAAGLCAAGFMAASADAAGAFPICHSPGEATNSGAPQDNDQQPAHQHICPFCAVHCHPAISAAPESSTLAARAVVFVPLDQPPPRIVQSARFPAGTPPRGPPHSI